MKKKGRRGRGVECREKDRERKLKRKRKMRKKRSGR